MTNGIQPGGPVPAQQLRSDISSVLQQMRQMREAAGAELDLQMRGADAPDGARTGGFGDLLKSAVDSVNQLQADAGAQTNAFVRGESSDLVSVMIATQKSNVAFQALTQVRNRVVSAYQDIMNMPI